MIVKKQGVLSMIGGSLGAALRTSIQDDWSAFPLCQNQTRSLLCPRSIAIPRFKYS